MGQRSASIRGRGQAEHGDRVAATGIAAEGGQGGRVEGPQGAAHDVGLSLAGPDQLLMAPGQHLDRLRQPRVALRRPVMMAVGADQVGQHPRIPTVRLGPRDGVALPIAAGRQRVHRHHLIADRHQRPDQQPPVSLDPDHHLGRVAGIAGDELVQSSHAHHPIDNPLAGQHPAVGGHHTHIMVTLGPINPDQQHRQLPSPLDTWTRPGEGLRQPNGAVLNLGTPSHQPSASSPSRRGHGLDEGAQLRPLVPSGAHPPAGRTASLSYRRPTALPLGRSSSAAAAGQLGRPEGSPGGLRGLQLDPGSGRMVPSDTGRAFRPPRRGTPRARALPHRPPGTLPTIGQLSAVETPVSQIGRRDPGCRGVRTASRPGANPMVASGMPTSRTYRLIKSARAPASATYPATVQDSSPHHRGRRNHARDPGHRERQIPPSSLTTTIHRLHRWRPFLSPSPPRPIAAR